MDIKKIQNTALREVHEHGLYDRTDSPPEWNTALQGASAGDPILVKDPDDPRDDFYLVPLTPKGGKKSRGVWVILDTQTLIMREASLMNDWKSPTFPDQQDTQNLAQNTLNFPDGNSARIPADQIKPNTRNLVWRASTATILPYWPVKECRVPHPLTGVPTPIYLTQEGEIHTSLDEVSEPKKNSPSPQPSPKKGLNKLLLTTCAALTASTAYLALKPQPQAPAFSPTHPQKETTELKDHSEQIKKLQAQEARYREQNSNLKKEAKALKNNLGELKKLRERQARDQKKITQLVKEITELKKKKAVVDTPPPPDKEAKIAKLERRIKAIRLQITKDPLNREMQTWRAQYQSLRRELAALKKL